MSEQEEHQEMARGHLMAYAVEWLAEWSGQPLDALPAELSTGSRQWLKEHLKLLGEAWAPAEPRSPLLSVFSLVKSEGAADPPQRYWPAVALSLDDPVYPVSREKWIASADLWTGFLGEWPMLLAVGDGHRHEAFTHLLHKWAWAVPCKYGEPGVSLYEEFRALSALVHASGCGGTPAEEFLLVGGDVPGIQDFVYTITSKGAAKGLRGRSFFLQLLVDAVIRRLLADLGLPETNVVYAAGGNFMLVAPAGCEGQVESAGAAVNRALLEALEGDLALCLACQAVAAGELADGRFASRASRDLGRGMARKKARRFAELASEAWGLVFAPHGQGGARFCAVCQHERQAGEKGQPLEDGGWKCGRCGSFEELAQAIAGETLLMVVSDEQPKGESKEWQTLLWQVTGYWYDLIPDPKPGLPAGAWIYSINHPEFLGEHTQGFRLFANTTPREPDGQVRTFEGLADGATGLARVGVLRMDVDDLGRVLTRWMPERTMARTSALSLALDRFFAGWLDRICAEVMADPQMKGVPGGRDNLLYVIYAGGDDLFVVGAWDLMPPLAERIQERFSQYAGRNPLLHISAGITLEDRKFPLYQAAERAGEALDRGAKEMPTRLVEGHEVRKSAVSFLRMPLGWEDDAYPSVKELAEKLIVLTTEKGLPRSLLSTVRAIHDRYREDVRQAQERGVEGGKVYYGPWLWRKAYQLARIRQSYEKGKTRDVVEDLENLETDVLVQEKMPHVGLATRWAEYLTRGGGAE